MFEKQIFNKVKYAFVIIAFMNIIKKKLLNIFIGKNITIYGITFSILLCSK